MLDFRPVFRNRQAMAWITGYTVHTWELAALRAWAVTFLTVTAARLGAPSWMPRPAVLFTVAGLASVAVSVTGNEVAQKYGRSRVVLWAMTAAAALSLVTGWTAGVSFVLAFLAVLAWNVCIYLDSSALTAGTVGADPARRGATVGLHSMSGYGGGFLGPSVSARGWTLRAATACLAGALPSAISPSSPLPGWRSYGFSAAHADPLDLAPFGPH
ncbi:MAG: hypothetical protein ACJ8AW_34355 [Rhodopila sp.]